MFCFCFTVFSLEKLKVKKLKVAGLVWLVKV